MEWEEKRKEDEGIPCSVTRKDILFSQVTIRRIILVVAAGDMGDLHLYLVISVLSDKVYTNLKG